MKVVIAPRVSTSLNTRVDGTVMQSKQVALDCPLSSLTGETLDVSSTTTVLKNSTHEAF